VVLNVAVGLFSFLHTRTSNIHLRIESTRQRVKAVERVNLHSWNLKTWDEGLAHGNIKGKFFFLNVR
jgi:hypothetical protein